MLALDLSNYTSELSLSQANAWVNDGVGLAIIQAWPGKVHDQLSVCRSVGLPVDAYVFVYKGDTETNIRERLRWLDGYQIRRLWLDVEIEGVTIDEVRMALSVCDEYPTQQGPTGIYTALWYWPNYMGNTTEFSDRPLWDSHYDGNADAEQGFRPYGGWDHACIKQYAGTSTFDGVGNVDLDVLSIDEHIGGNDMACPDIPQDYKDKFGEDIDWPGVASNLEGIITNLQGQVRSVPQDANATVEAVRRILAEHGY